MQVAQKTSKKFGIGQTAQKSTWIFPIVHNAQKFLTLLKIFVQFVGSHGVGATRNFIIPPRRRFVNRQFAQTFSPLISQNLCILPIDNKLHKTEPPELCILHKKNLNLIWHTAQNHHNIFVQLDY